MSEPPAEILAALRDPDWYRPRPESVQEIQTHVSYVFIAPPYVWKVKKPRNLGFLDFSTLEQRREAVAAELAVNRRLAPSVYLEALGLALDPGAPGGVRTCPLEAPEAVEAVLKMRYLEPEGFLDQLVATGQATPTHVERLAERIAAFHREHPAPDGARRYGTPEAIGARCRENFAQIAQAAPWARGPWLSWAERFTELLLDHWNETFTIRARTQLVDGHGDLHAAHVHFADGAADGALAVIDAIEFSEAYRILDPASEIAFLVMDLDVRGARALADRFLERYAEFGDDPELRPLVDFYLVYRAYVRAKVAALTAVDPDVADLERTEAFDRARRYLELGSRYALLGRTPTILATCGPSGSGKSTVAVELATRLGIRRTASDQVRRALAGIAPDVPTGSPVGGGLYTPEMHRRTYAALQRQAIEDARRTGAAIADATFLEPAHRRAFTTACTEAGVRLIWLAFDAEPELLRDRVRQRPLGESEATLPVLEAQLPRWRPPLADEGDGVLWLTGTEPPSAVGHRLVLLHASDLARQL